MCKHYTEEQRGRMFERVSKWRIRQSANMGEYRGHVYGYARHVTPILHQDDSGLLLRGSRWGVWPHYQAEMPRVLVDNARDDALLVKSIWKASAHKRRCLVPAVAFFEWAGPTGGKWEVMFHRPDEAGFWIAGIWSPDPFGEMDGFALVTGAPNEALAALPHDRMPVILDDDCALEWLEPGPLSAESLARFAAPYPADKLVRRDMPPPPKRGKRTETLPGLDLAA